MYTNSIHFINYFRKEIVQKINRKNPEIRPKLVNRGQNRNWCIANR